MPQQIETHYLALLPPLAPLNPLAPFPPLPPLLNSGTIGKIPLNTSAISVPKEGSMGQVAAEQKQARAAAPEQPADEVFHPPQNVVEQANVQEYEELYKRSLEDPEGYWGDRAGELEWFKKWDKVLDDSNAPFYKWFVGGQTNIVHNALDRHVKTWRKNK